MSEVRAETLFDVESSASGNGNGNKKHRKPYRFKKSESNDGSLSIHFDPELGDELRAYCKKTNQNCKTVATRYVKKGLQEDKENRYQNMSREELIQEIKLLEGEKK